MVDLDAYLQDEVVRLASERLLEIIGKALNAASRDEPTLIQAIPDISFAVGLRNKIAHDYDDISNEVIWDTIEHNIPPLRLHIETAMEYAPPLQDGTQPPGDASEASRCAEQDRLRPG